MEKCVSVRGTFQDIDVRKKAEILAEEILQERNIILESIDDAFFAVDKDWTVTYWNKMASIVLQRSKQEMLGNKLWDVFHDAVNSKSFKQYHLAFATAKPVHFEDYYNPLKKWYEVSVYPSKNGLSVYFKDVTDRKRNDKLLKASEKRYSQLFQLSPLPKWVYDQETLAFLDVNDAALQHYGYSREEFLGMTIKDIRPPSHVAILDNVLKLYRKKKTVLKQGTFLHQTKQGKTISVDIQSNAITYKGRQAKIIIATDITDRLEYIKAIEAQNVKLMEISWIQSHMVRAPLAKILSLTALLSKEKLDAQDAQILEYLITSAKELDDFIEEISGKTRTST